MCIVAALWPLVPWCSAIDAPDPIRAGGVGKAKSPTLQERLQHQQRTARSSVSSACTGTSSDSTSGHSNGTADGGGVCGGTGASSAAGTGSWTEEDKAALLSIVQEVSSCTVA
jgi:hypothetical protein